MSIPSIITIDGPAASGKSTLGKLLAEKLGYLYFDTGVMYRALTWLALQRRIPIQDEQAITQLAETIPIEVTSPSKPDGRAYDVWVNGQDITWDIRKPEVDANVSIVSAYAGVRKALSEQQRRIGLRGNVIMVGRDIGTVVLPEAPLKFYLDASLEERARRRYQELVSRSQPASFDEILASMKERDRIDSTRQIAPLRPAPDAVFLQSDGLGIQDIFELALRYIQGDPPSSQQASSRKSAPSPAAASTDQLYRVPFFNRLMRLILRPIFRGIFHLLSPIRIYGKENIPKHGPYLVAINHVSIFEAPFIVAFWPVELEAMGAVEIWHRKGQDILARLYGGIQVHRGEYDRRVMDKVLAVLRSGRPLLIAPEGTRSHKPGMQRAFPGVAYLMDKAGVPVVPVGIVGTTEDYFHRAIHFQRPVLEMHIGKPIILPPVSGTGEQRRQARQRNADLVMLQIAALLPQEYRGVYAHFDPSSIGENQ
ncbi:MAG: (d)CMP kinase [Chloroflexota bacterium]